MTKSPEDIVIRFAGPGDHAALAGLIEAFRRAEGKAGDAAVTAEEVARWTSGDAALFEALVARSTALGPGLQGYLAFYRAFSFFKKSPVLLVENLFVQDQARGLGLGRRLLAAVAAEARSRGYARLELTVGSANQAAQRFYHGLGLHQPGELVYRIEDDALERLAGAGELGFGSRL